MRSCSEVGYRASLRFTSTSLAYGLATSFRIASPPASSLRPTARPAACAARRGLGRRLRRHEHAVPGLRRPRNHYPPARTLRLLRLPRLAVGGRAGPAGGGPPVRRDP